MAVSIDRARSSPARSGRRGFPPARIHQLQRSRLIHALIELVEAGDGPQPTVTQIVGRARASRKTFYDHFRGREDCFLAAFEETFIRARAIACIAYDDQPTWRAGIRAGLECLLLQLDQEPGRARLCVVDSLGAGARVQLRRQELIGQLAEVIDLGRHEGSSGADLPEMAAEAIVGGVSSILHDRLVRNERRRLVDLLSPLMSMIVLPYLGPDAAVEEQKTPSKGRRQRRERGPAPDGDLLSGMRMRLTYRTVRVLVAIAGRPGASNRQIATDAGISDQGQISKLLVRLTGLGLVENRGAGQPKGQPNAWWLTAKGALLEQTTRLRLS